MKHRWSVVVLLATRCVLAAAWYDLPSDEKEAESRLAAVTAQLRLRPQDAALHFEAAKILHFFRNDQKGALAHLRAALAADSRNAAAWNLRALTESCLLDLKSAVRSTLKACRVDPEHPAALGAAQRLHSLYGQTPGFAALARLEAEKLHDRKDYVSPEVWDAARTLLVSLCDDRGEYEMARRLRREAGVIEEWLVMGPFGKYDLAAFKSIYPPETEDRPRKFYVRDQATVGSGREMVRPRVDRFVNDRAHPRGRVEEGAYYFVTYVRGEKRARILLHMECGFSFKLFVNRRLVLSSNRAAEWRPVTYIQGLELPAGWSKVVVKLIGSSGSRPSFVLRLRSLDGRAANLKTQARLDSAPSIASQPAAETFEADLGSRSRLRRLCARSPAPPWPALMLAQAKMDWGDREGAKALLFGARPRLPRYSLLAQELGDVLRRDISLYRDIRNSRAREWYRRAVEMWPGNPLAFDRLAEMDAQAGLYDEAWKKLKKAERLAPNAPAWAQRRFELARSRGWRREAIEAYEQVRKALPESLTAAQISLEYWRRTGDWRRYEECARFIARRRPLSSVLASYYERSRRFEDAKRELERLSRIRPRSEYIIQRRAMVSQKMGRYKDAWRLFDALDAIQGPAAPTLLLRGELQWLMGGDAKAVECVKQAYALAPSSLTLYRSLRVLGEPDETDRFVMRYEDVMADRRHHDLPHHGVASAYLLDQAVLMIRRDGSSVERVHQIVKVYNKRGVSRWATVTIPTDAEILLLHTIKPDGRTLEPTRLPGRGEWGMAGLTPGDIVEYDYIQVRGPQFFPGAYLGPSFIFKDARMHMERSQYVVIAPKEWRLMVDARHGAPRARQTLLRGRRVYKWEVLASKEAGDLPNSLPDTERMPFVRVAYNLTWRDAQQKLLSDIAGRTRLSYELKEIVKSIAAKHAGAKERLQAAYDCVNERIKGAVSSGFFGMSAGAILSVGKGNRIVVLKALLDGLGVRSQFVLLAPRTGPHLSRKIPDMYGTRLTACVLRVDLGKGKTMWVDTSFRCLPLGYLLPANRQSWGLVLDDSVREPLVLTPDQKDQKDMVAARTEVKVGANGSATAVVREECWGLFGVATRYEYQRLSAAQRRQARERRVAALLPGAALKKFAIENLADSPKPLVFNYTFSAPHFVRIDGHRGMMRVGFYPFLPGRRYARERKRRSGLIIRAPVNCRDVVRIELPVGMRPVAPENMSKSTGFGECHYVYRLEGNVLIAERRIHIPIQRVPGVMYKKFAEFVRAIDREDLRVLDVRITPESIPKKAEAPARGARGAGA